MPNKRGRRGEVVQTLDPNLVSREMRVLEPPDIPPALLSLFRSTVDQLARREGPKNILPRLYRAAHQGMLVYPAQHTVIDILNSDGDAEITFLFEASNFGIPPIPSGVYPFWFDQPQDEVPFRCCGVNDEPLFFEVVRSSPNMREIRLFFRQPLQAMEGTCLRISFRLRKVFAGDCFYYLRPRALAKLIGLSVLAPEGVGFDNPNLTRESVDGFVSDDSPVAELSREGKRMKLHWIFDSPTSGDLFRTSWSYSNTTPAPRSKSRGASVVQLRRNGRSKFG